jgi:hypothetical protein
MSIPFCHNQEVSAVRGEQVAGGHHRVSANAVEKTGVAIAWEALMDDARADELDGSALRGPRARHGPRRAALRPVSR